MSIVMTGGGTGGHLAIIKAVKEYLAEEELIYIGSFQGQDRQWFLKDDDFAQKYFLDTRGVVNQGILGKAKSIWMLARATMQAIRFLRRHKASVVFSVGGFSAAASSFAAKILGIPLVIHEQNASIGSLNRLLKPYAAEFISSYEDDSSVKAYPIKKVFFDRVRIRSDIETIIFLGGSQGAMAINKLAFELAPKLKQKGIQIIHQAGENNIDEVKDKYSELGIEAEVFGFTDRLDDYMSEADFAIARAGASTLWELSAITLPTLYIPYPYAAGDHQYYNAKFLADKGLAWIMREGEIDIEYILTLLDKDMAETSRGLINIVEKDGAEKIAKLLTQF